MQIGEGTQVVVSEVAIKNRVVAFNSVLASSLTTPGESSGKDRLVDKLDLSSTSNRHFSSFFYTRLFGRIHPG